MDAESEVRELEERLRLADASDAPDTSDVFAELFAPDAVLTGPTGRFELSALLDGHRPPKRRKFDLVAVNEMIVRAFGDTVAVSARTDYVVGSRSFAQRTLRVWHRSGRSWSVVFLMMATVPPQQA